MLKALKIFFGALMLALVYAGAIFGSITSNYHGLTHFVYDWNHQAYQYLPLFINGMVSYVCDFLVMVGSLAILAAVIASGVLLVKQGLRDIMSTK